MKLVFCGRREVLFVAVFSVAFSPDGRFVLLAERYNTLGLWDVAANQHLKSLDGVPKVGNRFSEKSCVKTIERDADSSKNLPAKLALAYALQGAPSVEAMPRRVNRHPQPPCPLADDL
jgi:hypothetical protein